MEVVNPPSTEDAQPLFRKRATKKSSALRKRPATPPPASDSDTSGYSSASGDGNEDRRVKRRRKTAAVTASSTTLPKSALSDDITSTTTKYTGDRSAQIQENHDATKHSNWYDSTAAETTNSSAKTLLGTTRPLPSSSSSSTTNPPPAAANDGTTYRGAANYQRHIPQNPNAPSSKTVGPVKAPTNVRTITTTDFAPDVCKDYKQTGFCGFGDGCKFLHAREDYKQGWELDREWEKVGAGRSKKGKKTIPTKGAGGEGLEEDEDEDEDALLAAIPFACIICKEAYKNPIVTKCGHYFCEACALRRYRKSPSCAACGAGTGGVFNGAKGLKKLLEKKKERARKRREKAIADGEDVSDEDLEGMEGEGGAGMKA
ncbi:MAG: hypothetical protein Q9202_007222 [Teloschistes flavicans]